jgi:hypothetical protein
VVAALWVELLSVWRHYQVRLDLTVAENFQALARLGGYQNRRDDGPRDWLVLWRSWGHMQNMLEYILAPARGAK